MYRRLCHLSSLLTPDQILAVVCLAELAVGDAATPPCIDVPCIALGDAARLERMVALPELEMHHAVLAVVGRALQERDHVR